MSTESPAPMSGRKAQAARNDQLILDAARAVFTANPDAPIAAVAERAGVGISALYRRYRSKDELLRQLAHDGLASYVAEVEAALADDGDPWDAFCRFMQRCLEAGASSVTARFAGSFTTTDEMNQLGRRSYELTRQLIERTQAAGVLRADIDVGDTSFLFSQLQSVQVGDPPAHQPIPPALPGTAARRTSGAGHDPTTRSGANLGRYSGTLRQATPARRPCVAGAITRANGPMA